MVLCACMFVGLWVCVFVLVHVIVGVRVDVFLCLCVFMLCVFVSVAILRTQLNKRRDTHTKGCMCFKFVCISF